MGQHSCCYWLLAFGYWCHPDRAQRKISQGALAKSYHEILRFTQDDTKGDDSADGVFSLLLSKATLLNSYTPTLALHSKL